MDLVGKSVLLFCPKFFGYEKEIIKILEELGANVIWFDDRPSNDFISKGLIRLNKNFLKTRIKTYYENILSHLIEGGKHFDYVFLVNPESISKENLQKFQHAFPTAKFLLYMWDSFQNRRQNIELLPLFDAKFTFDPSDAKEYGLQLRALFYTKVYEEVEKLSHYEYDILFIGTAHSDRYEFVKRLTKNIGEKRTKLYFYLSSKLLFYTKKIIDKDFRAVRYKDISFFSLKHTDIVALMCRSNAVLDINHPKQLGLTMRTFETLGAQLKLITTNKDVMEYDFYDPSNILVINRDQPLINMKFLSEPGKKLSPEILFKYSIKGWAMEIFDIL